MAEDIERIRKRQQLLNHLHGFADAVHRINGRTDQALRDKVLSYPDYEAVKAYVAADQAYREFEMDAHAAGDQGKLTRAAVERHLARGQSADEPGETK